MTSMVTSTCHPEWCSTCSNDMLDESDISMWKENGKIWEDRRTTEEEE